MNYPKDLPQQIKNQASLYRRMALTTSSAKDRHDYRFQAQKLDCLAEKLLAEANADLNQENHQ